MSEITSVKNPRIQRIIKLREKSRERKQEGLFLIEGGRELLLAMKGNYTIREIYYNTEIADSKIIQELRASGKQLQWSELEKGVYEKIAVRGTTEGLIAVAEIKRHDIKDLKLSKNPLLLVIENVEKPGNLGALLRTADAAGLDAVIICDPAVDLYNPNVVRSSLGCVFINQIAVSDSMHALSWLRKKNVSTLAATPDAEKNYAEADLKESCAIIVGSEAEGLSDYWMNNADEKILIPMSGEIDSLNVSVSAAIILFEALRQRANS